MLFVIPRGFEPRTHSLEGCCSIQLSYGTVPRFSYVAERTANIRIYPERAGMWFVLFENCYICNVLVD